MAHLIEFSSWTSSSIVKAFIIQLCQKFNSTCSLEFYKTVSCTEIIYGGKTNKVDAVAKGVGTVFSVFIMNTLTQRTEI